MNIKPYLLTAVMATALSALPFTTMAAGAGDTGGKESKGASTSGGQSKTEGRHSMNGTVTDIDHKTGIVGLKTPEGDLKLHFPPKSLSNVKEGEQLQVHMSFSPAK